MELQSQPPPSAENSPKNESSFPTNGAPSTTATAPLSPDELSKVFAWAQGEAERNAAARRVHGPELIRVARDPEAMLKRIEAAKRVAPPATSSEDEREKRERIGRLVEANGVPPRYRRAAFNGFHEVPAEIRDPYHEASQDLRSLSYRAGIIVLMGPRGTGKTHLACALVNEFCRQCRHAVYAEAMDYFLKLDAEINARGSVLKIEAQFLRPELLVLDAMEERADTPAKDRMLTRLIDKRYAAELSTVLITNETQEKFVERVGPSVTDRIRDDGQMVVCDWRSLRGKIPEAPAEGVR